MRRVIEFVRLYCGAVVLGMTGGASLPVLAGSEATERPALREVWVHAFAARKTWSLTNGTTWTPSTSHVAEGVRLRLIGGLDGYKYTSRQYDSLTPNGRLVEHFGMRQTVEALGGWQWRIGPWTLKAFAGVAARRTMIESDDPELGTEKDTRWQVGAKAVGEAWWHISETAWASVDLGYATLDHAYSARMRLGWRPQAHWSIGPELLAYGTPGAVWSNHTQRIGVFARFDNGVHEVSASAGLDRTSEQKDAAYTTLQYLYRF